MCGGGGGGGGGGGVTVFLFPVPKRKRETQAWNTCEGPLFVPETSCNSGNQKSWLDGKTPRA